MLKNIKEYVANRKLEIKEQVEKLVSPPSLLIIQTGDNEASNRYVKNKMKDCDDVGIHADVIKMYSTEDYRARWITESLTKHYQGVIVQLPSQIKKPQALFHECQDVDGFKNPDVTPCTPKGIMDYLAYCGYEDFSGTDVLIINRSEIVGRPLAKLFLDKNATVTVAHSKTLGLKEKIAAADIIVTAVGQPNFITKDMIKSTQIVIDVGIAFDENGKLCGDCERGMGDNVTPVPGGVGLLTRLALLDNIMLLNPNKMEV